MDKKSLLEWYMDAGVDEAIDDRPTNYFAALASGQVNPLPMTQEAGPRPYRELHQQPSSPGTAQAARPAPSIRPTAPQPAAAAPLHHTPSAAIATARTLADSAGTLEDLERIVREFDGCAIKKTASRTVFSDGNPKAQVMIIGEAPGAQEDKQGIPFCGPSGQLLDKMLAAIGLDRTSVYISNTVFWRPPGNRQPSPEETSICLPLVEKHIALVSPRLLILSGGTATTTLLQRDMSISRLRGRFYDYSNPYIDTPIPTLLMYHPSYLLRQPLHKRLAWNDLQLVRDFLKGN